MFIGACYAKIVYLSILVVIYIYFRYIYYVLNIF